MARARRCLLLLPLLVVGAGFSCAGPQGVRPSGPTVRSYGKPETLCRITDPEVDESSGIAPSLTQPGVWYTHNDSGDSARFFRFDESGKVTAVFSLEGAQALDWEDMASAKVGEKRYLYFGDIGDNAERRSSVVVYRVEEPRGVGRTLVAFDRFELTYPDGPHNSETLMVRPETGDLYLVAKTAKGPAGVYRLDGAAAPGKHGLRRVGELNLPGALEPMRLATGGDVSPDGRYVVVRTYLGAYEYATGQGSAFDDWMASRPKSVALAGELQGEGIAYSRDGRWLVTTSEKTPCPVSRVEIVTSR
jgi:hypothetical protein